MWIVQLDVSVRKLIISGRNENLEWEWSVHAMIDEFVHFEKESEKWSECDGWNAVNSYCSSNSLTKGNSETKHCNLNLIRS